MKIELIDAEQVISKLSDMADVDWDKLGSKQADALKARSDYITPYRTGALRNSATFDNGEFGYTVDYADDVNYGHRTRGGTYVGGRHFLEEIVNGQDKEYKDEVLKHLKGKAR